MKPLEDLRILSIEQFASGPFGSVQLADLGAEVIKIEDPSSGGDVGRYVPPYQDESDSLFFETFNRNKRSICLDLTNDEGKRIFHDLVKKSDVVYSNLRGDVPSKIGLMFEDLKEFNPKIVCCSLSGYGMTGPRASDPGYDYMVQGLAGWMDITGEPSGPPTKSGLSVVDFSSGLIAAISILAGVHQARRDGVGMNCDVSLFDTALSMLTYPATWNLNGEFVPTRTRHSAHPSLVPFQAFLTSDEWIVVGCAKEKFWSRLATELGREDLADDPRYDSFVHRRENSESLLPELEAEFIKKSADEWLSTLSEAGIPCGRVNTVEEALNEAQTINRKMIVETSHPRFGTVRQIRSAVRVGDSAPEYRRAPFLGEHKDIVLRELLNYSDELISDATKLGAFG